MLIPKREIERSTSFIVEDEAWYVVEYDHTSVPGIMYISLTEEKVNYIYDDLENEIADTDKMAKYEILLPEKIQNFNVGEEISPIYTITKNGKPVDFEVVYSSGNKKIARIIDGKLMAVGKGKVEISIQLKEFPDIVQTIVVNVGEEPEFDAYLNGEATIKLDRSSIYELIGNMPLDSAVSYSISEEDQKLATIVEIKDGQCVVRANAKNRIGALTLTAIYKDVTYTKEIKIIPLW